MKSKVFSVEGKELREVELPKVFSEEIDPALIKRAVLSIESANFQPKGTFRRAGRENTAVYRGRRSLPAMERSINVEHARLPRLKNRRGLLQGNVASIPRAVGGPKAHPAKKEKILIERINKKEKRKATRSAIAATAVKALVENRGHLVKDLQIPLIVENKLEEIEKTKELISVLKKLKVFADVEKASAKKQMRAGKGKTRGRKYKVRKSLLLVTGQANEKIFRAARNLEGVDIVRAKDLNAKLLAPGTKAGRLTLYTENALKLL